MAGLKNVRDLGLDAYMAAPVEVTPVNVSPVVGNASPVVVDVVNTDSIDEVKETAPPAPRAKKSKAKLTPAPSWQQTGLSITKSTMMRLRFESLQSGKTMSEVTEMLLDKHLPKWSLSKESA